MKNISVITTGGTIGSMLAAKAVTLDSTAKRLSREIEVAKNKLGCAVEVTSPISKNSEDFLPDDWALLLSAVQEANQSDSDGILITHGTDTLAYSVAAINAFAHLWDKKICFTGSFYSPDHPESDVSISLLAALEFIVSPHPSNGVYVAFRSSRHNNQANILDGAAIKPMGFDEEFFTSAYATTVSHYAPKEGLSNQISMSSISLPTIDSQCLPTVDAIQNAKSKVAMLSLYPGIDRELLQSVARNRDVLVIDMYHSGTGPADKSGLMSFLSDLPEGLIVLMGTFPREYIDLPYESTVTIRDAGAHIYADLQSYFLYVFSVLGLASGMSSKDLVKALQAHAL